MPSELQTRLKQVTAALTRQGLPLGATITPRTLALAEGEIEGTAATLPDSVAATSRAVAVTRDLPRISLADPSSPCLPSEPLSSPGRRADLELRGLLGEGGMGRVHAAHQRSLERDVAVKTVKDASSTAVVEALLREARIMGSLEHPAIVPVHALGVDERGRPLIVMKRVDGVEWRALLADGNHPRWQALTSSGADRLEANLEILMQVCRAANYAHSHGILHRDIKPENVLIGEFGEAYLADFGIAIADHEVRAADPRRALVGTPAYMAPEMVLGEPLDRRTDVYLLGATLHEVLTGRYRHEGEHFMALFQAALESRAIAYRDEVPEELAELCNRATTRSREARPQTALEVEEALALYLRHRGAIALAEAAETRLNELAERMRDETMVSSRDGAAALRRLATEAHFGFVESLREWPENPSAIAGRGRVLELMVDLDLAQDNVAAARAQLLEHDAPPVELVERVEQAERRVELRRAEDRKYRAFAHDLDPSVSSEQRTRTLWLLVALTLTISFYTFFSGVGTTITPKHALTISLIVLGGALGASFVWRKALFGTAFNRRVSLTLFIAIVGMVTSRFGAYVDDLPARWFFAQDLLLLAGIASVSAVAFLKRMWASVPVLLLAWFGVRLHPEHAAQIFTTAVSIIVLIVVWASGQRPSSVVD